MLSELAIKNFAIIDDLRISFYPGLTVLTGETGAGKSIIIQAVNLLLGSRASADLVRTGADAAELEAGFDISPDSKAARILTDQDLDPAEGLIIRRIIAANGRHRIFINDRRSTMQLLKQVTQNLASISSQHAHQGLLKEENHLDILDDFAGTRPLRHTVRSLFRELTPLKQEMTRLKLDLEKTREDNQLIRFQVEEIEEAAIQPGEDEALERRRKQLQNGSALFACLRRGVDEVYAGEDAVLELLGRLASDLSQLGEGLPEITQAADKLSRVIFELEDLAETLRRQSQTIDLDPATLEETEARLDRIQKLKRKYQKTDLGALFAFLEDLKARLGSTEETAQRINNLEEQISVLTRDLARNAAVLSHKRKKAALALAGLVEKELRSLEMDRLRFEVRVTSTPVKSETPGIDPNPSGKGDPPAGENGMIITETGMDRVSFLMAPNPGEPPRPLSRIASGGELSRVVLALKAILSEMESTGTLVFDEVDAGIGGKTADKVGLKLARLSSAGQVICITHLAQIARFADHHYQIEKKVADQRTTTCITPLEDREARVRELARMTGGSTITQATRQFAGDMLDSAADR